MGDIPKNNTCEDFWKECGSSSVSDDFYHDMMSPKAVELAHPYVREEKDLLVRRLKALNCLEKNLVVVGGGPLWYVEEGLTYASYYTCIEPLLSKFVSPTLEYVARRDAHIHLIEGYFQEAHYDKFIKKSSNIFFFMFNIISYIYSPIVKLNNVVKPGDVVVLSTWNRKNEKSMKVRKEYFDFLNKLSGEIEMEPTSPVGMFDINEFPIEELKLKCTAKIEENEIISSLTLYF